jgi:hypothetical protein
MYLSASSSSWCNVSGVISSLFAGASFSAVLDFSLFEALMILSTVESTLS